MRQMIESGLRLGQRVIAGLSYRVHARRPKTAEISWVVGPEEIASMLSSIAHALPNSYSVCLVPHAFYSGPYDYTPKPRLGGWPAQKLREAWEFGRLAALAEGFIYVGGNGFLATQNDARAFEFEFLKRRGLRVICYFTGSDIRSLRVIAEVEKKVGLPNGASYLPTLSPVFASDSYDEARRALARTADEHADLIFTAAVDQAGYLTRETEPFMYFFDEVQIIDSLAKFDDLARLVVVHAASSPIPKGTQLVRAAVAAMRAEGFDFEYVELLGAPHEEVKRQLSRSHIVLNQFYAYVLGVFGVEALAAGAVVLSSADEYIETDLPEGSNEAWIVTYHYQVTEHLRQALQLSGAELREQAERGQRWVREHATAEVSGRRLRRAVELLSR